MKNDWQEGPAVKRPAPGTSPHRAGDLLGDDVRGVAGQLATSPVVPHGRGRVGVPGRELHVGQADARVQGDRHEAAAASVTEVWPQFCECSEELADEAAAADHDCEWEEPDLSDCPYFRKYHRLTGADEEGAWGSGTCTYGCWDEPHCVTSRPPEGWPGEAALTAPSPASSSNLAGELRGTKHGPSDDPDAASNAPKVAP